MNYFFLKNVCMISRSLVIFMINCFLFLGIFYVIKYFDWKLGCICIIYLWGFFYVENVYLIYGKDIRCIN